MSTRPFDRKQPGGPHSGGVDKQVRSFYRRATLPPERAQALLDAAHRHRVVRRRRRLLAAAAVLVVAAGIALVRTVLDARALGDRVAAEVVLGHTKDLDVEIATSSYADLAEALDKLTFPLHEPARLRTSASNYELVGGRYCSIQAQLAALLKVQDARGRTATLYVTGLSAELDSLPGTTRSLEGVEIDVWNEHDLLYALVRDAS
ncbi:MAG: hypothetical protein AAGC60_26450 [Acidobacteriota bacterium]